MTLGLKEKEASIYLAALELGPASVQKIAEKAGVNRATAYTNIEVLTQLGLMSTEKYGKKMNYLAAPPEEIITTLIAREEEKLERQEAELNKILPDLKELHSRSLKSPIVRYFEGRDGVMSMISEVFQSRDTIMRFIYPHDKMKAFSDKDRDNAVNQRIEKNIYGKAITFSHEGKEKKIFKNGEGVIIDASKFDISCDIAFFGNQIRIITFEDPIIGIIIYDPIISDAFKKIFDYLFDRLLLDEREDYILDSYEQK